MSTNTFNIAITGMDDVRHLAAQAYNDVIETRSLQEVFDRNATLYGDNPAVTALNGEGDVVRTWTHSAFREELYKVAALMHASYSPDGTRTTVLLCRSHPLISALLWGTQIAGVASCVNYLLAENTLAALIGVEQAEVLVLPGPDVDPELWSKGCGVASRLDGLRRIYVLGTLPQGHDDPRFAEIEPLLRTTVPARKDELPPADFNRLSAMFHTGGTTGAPKLVPLTEGNQIHSAWSFGRLLDLNETDVVLNGLPMFHVGGTITFHMSVLFAGGHMVVAGPDGFRSQQIVQNYWGLIERHKVTYGGGVPTTIGTLTTVSTAGKDISSLRRSLSGGAQISKAVADRYEAVSGAPLLEQYGMTETAAFVAAAPLRGPRLRGSVGLHCAFSAVRVVADDGMTPLPSGESGPVQLTGPNMFKGYVNPEHNIGLFSDDGWMNTGDIGYLTELGQLVLSGRAKDVIIRSAHNIDPKIIEEVADGHADVAVSAAVGMPDAYAGEVPVVYVELKPGCKVDTEQLRTYICDRVPEPPARPKAVFVIDKVPTTGVGKIYKPTLRERVVADKVRMILKDWHEDAEAFEINASLQSGQGASVAITLPPTRHDLREALRRELATMDIKLV